MDYTEQKKLAAAVNKIGANINSSHLILLLPGVLEENADFRTENAPAIHSSSGAFLLAVFGFYRLLTASVLYGIAGRLSLSYSAAHYW